MENQKQDKKIKQEINPFQGVYEKIQSTDSLPVEVSECEVKEEVDRINRDSDTSDRG